MGCETLLPVAAFALLLSAFPAQPQSFVGVASVIDGDTIEIHGQRIRLFGIDAPEGRQPCFDRAGNQWRCGPEAANALAGLIGRSSVQCDQQDRDRYGRVVARCYLGGVDLSEWMVERGWAAAYRQYSRDYVDDEEAARSAGRGVWAGTMAMPWEWRRQRN